MRIISVEAEINRAFISPNEADRNGEEANVTDGLFAIARALSDVADAIHYLGTNRAAFESGRQAGGDSTASGRDGG